MLKRFLPKENNFFRLFNDAISQLVQVSELLQKILEEPNASQHYLQQLRIIEQRGDKTSREAFTLLHKTFITPFDRYDINQLVRKLDRIVDYIHLTATYLQAYEVTVIPPEMLILGNLSIRSAKMLQTAISQLDSLKNSPEILKCADAVSDAEDTAQELLVTALARLFKEENDLKYLVKLKEMYKNLRKIMEGYQEVANIIRTIVLEYA